MDDRLLIAEGLSSSALQNTGLEAVPIDILALALAHGLSAQPARHTSLRGPLLEFDEGLPIPRKRSAIAHELGHHLAKVAGEDDRDEHLAWAIGGALLMPSRDLKREVFGRAWDLEELPGIYGVSWEMLARRLVSVMGSVISVWDNGRLSRRWRSPWLRGCGWCKRRPPTWEHDFAQLCVKHACHVTEDGGLRRAYWVPSPGWRRVVVVSEIESWEAATTLE